MIKLKDLMNLSGLEKVELTELHRKLGLKKIKIIKTK